MSMLCAIFLEASLLSLCKLTSGLLIHFVHALWLMSTKALITPQSCLTCSLNHCGLYPAWFIYLLLVCTTFSLLTDMPFNLTLFLYSV